MEERKEKHNLCGKALKLGLAATTSEFWKEVYSFARSENLNPVEGAKAWIEMRSAEPEQVELGFKEPNYAEEVALSYDHYQEQEDEFNRPRFSRREDPNPSPDPDKRSVSKKWETCPVCHTSMQENSDGVMQCGGCGMEAEEEKVSNLDSKEIN